MDHDHTDHADHHCYIFKSDDVIRDAILLGIMQIMDDILTDEMKISFDPIR